MEQLITTEALIALLTLTSLEIVLGIDNIIFLTILVDRLPPQQREKARLLGLSLAMLTRIGLLLSLTWVMGLTDPLFTPLPGGYFWQRFDSYWRWPVSDLQVHP